MTPVGGDDQMSGVDTGLDPPGQFSLLLGAEQRGRENEFRGIHARNAAIVRETGPVFQMDHQHRGKK